MTRGYCGQCGDLYSDEVPCECQRRAGMSEHTPCDRTSMIDTDRKYTDPMMYDISIDLDDAADGTEGGYDRHGNFVIPSAMQEILRLRSEVERLTEKIDRIQNPDKYIIQENLNKVNKAFERFLR